MSVGVKEIEELKKLSEDLGKLKEKIEHMDIKHYSLAREIELFNIVEGLAKYMGKEIEALKQRVKALEEKR